jgi:hypothetical protein
MQSPDMLINALVDEDCRMREIVQKFPPELRDVSPGDDKLGLKDTLAHISYWDEFTVRYFEALYSGRKIPTPSFQDFEASTAELQQKLKSAPFGDIMDNYLRATRKLLGMLRTHWDMMKPEEHRNLALPLRHRRHHRRLLMELAGLAPEADSEKMAGA